MPQSSPLAWSMLSLVLTSLILISLCLNSLQPFTRLTTSPSCWPSSLWMW